MKGHLKSHGFSLIELMLVVIIFGIIAGFTLPNFQKSIVRGQVRQTRNTLAAMAAANEMYRAREDRYWPDPDDAVTDLAVINTGLGIDLSAVSGMTYSCTTPRIAGAGYSCTASLGGVFGFTVSVTEANQTPVCTQQGGNLAGNNPC